jgi:hypothetical protein
MASAQSVRQARHPAVDDSLPQCATKEEAPRPPLVTSAAAAGARLSPTVFRLGRMGATASRALRGADAAHVARKLLRVG